MTVLLTGHIQFGAGEGENLRPALAAHVEKVRAEEGCESYAFAFDVADPDRLWISERWASREALAAHGQQEHQKAFGRSLRERDVAEVRLETWTAEPLPR